MDWTVVLEEFTNNNSLNRLVLTEYSMNLLTLEEITV
jgi:hypothetical protein